MSRGRVGKKEKVKPYFEYPTPKGKHPFRYDKKENVWICRLCGYILGTASKQLKDMPACPKNK